MKSLKRERLKQALRYDAETGTFTWAMSLGRARSGCVAGYTNKLGYVEIGIDGKLYLAHRLAWFCMTGKWPIEIDHKVGKSNAFCNLREATSRLNKENQRAARSDNKSTGLLGAYKHGRRFKAQIRANDRQRHLGVFDTAEQAHAAYVTAKRELHAGCTI